MRRRRPPPLRAVRTQRRYARQSVSRASSRHRRRLFGLAYAVQARRGRVFGSSRTSVSAMDSSASRCIGACAHRPEICRPPARYSCRSLSSRPSSGAQPLARTARTCASSSPISPASPRNAAPSRLSGAASRLRQSAHNSSGAFLRSLVSWLSVSSAQAPVPHMRQPATRPRTTHLGAADGDRALARITTEQPGDHLAQIADVSGIGAAEQVLLHAGIELRGLGAGLLEAQKVPGQRQDVLRAHAQRR